MKFTTVTHWHCLLGSGGLFKRWIVLWQAVGADGSDCLMPAEDTHLTPGAGFLQGALLHQTNLATEAPAVKSTAQQTWCSYQVGHQRGPQSTVRTERGGRSSRGIEQHAIWRAALPTA